MALTIPAAFPTTDEIESAIQSYRGNSSSLPSVDDTVISTARRQAYGYIFIALKDRGYSKAQIDAWDLLWEFGIDLSQWYYWRSRIGANQDGGKDVETLPDHWDRREELATVLLTEDGEIIDLANATADIGYGNLTWDGTETFNLDTEW